MPLIPDFGFCGPTYTAITPVLDAQDSLNLYPETAQPDSKAQIALIGTPGLDLFMTLPTGPVRAMYAGNGRLFAVGGNHFYEVSNAGAVLTDYGALGGSTGTGPAQIFANTIDIIVMDSSVSQVFCVTDGPPAITFVIDAFNIEYLDTFYLALAVLGTNQVNQSGSLDGLTWNALDFAQRTGVPDFVNAISIINNQLWWMGQKNLELWSDVGTSPFAFARIGGTTINEGCLCRFSVVKLDNTIYWIGGDDRGYAIVYRGSGGAQPVRVSTHAIEHLMGMYNIQSEATIQSGNVRAFAYQEQGHTFYVINFNDANGGLGATLAYDITTKLWHRRCYLNPGSGDQERIRADCFASVAGFGAGTGYTQNFVGDYANGNIYLQDLDTPDDNGAPKIYQRTAPHTGAANQWTFFKELIIDADIGDADIVLDYSNDGGLTFANNTPVRTITKSGDVAVPGGFGRYIARRLGRSRDRVFRATITSSTESIRLINAYLYADARQTVGAAPG